VQGATEDPLAYVERLSVEKAAAVASRHPEALVIAGDTVVALDEAILEKPGDSSEAVEMLLRLQGRDHVVHTGLALVAPGGSTVSVTESPRVTFRSFGRSEARAYVASEEPLDKAGAYGIQGFGSTLVESIDGDYFAVVGLSPSCLRGLLLKLGLRYAFGSVVRVS